MKFTVSITGAALLLSGSMFAGIVSGSAWAQFCDDTACSVNCGIAVDVDNPGCLAHEGGRKSFSLHGSNFLGSFLVHSPGDNCDCQSDCTEISGTGAAPCVDISSAAPSKSFRFQRTTCNETEGGPGTGNNCKPSANLTPI